MSAADVVEDFDKLGVLIELTDAGQLPTPKFIESSIGFIIGNDNLIHLTCKYTLDQGESQLTEAEMAALVDGRKIKDSEVRAEFSF